MRKKLLVAAANHWTSPFQVGSHELTKCFLNDGWQVAFISDPVSILHLFKKKHEIISDRFEIYKSNGRFQHNKNLWHYVPFAMVSPQNFPLLRSKFLYSHWISFTIPALVQKIKNVGFDNADLAYFDSILYASLVDKIKFKKSVFRIADANSGFNKFSRNSSLFEAKLAASVDLVIYSAHTLKSYVDRYEANDTLLLPNGVDFNFFYNGSKDLPDDLASVPPPRITYVGAMHEWFDAELINFAAKSLPDVSFVLIGNSGGIINKISDLHNIHLLGLKPYSEIPKYLHNSDAGIIPFKVKQMGKLVHSINPLKLYQFFACGLPVIAANWEELINLNSPAHLYNTKNEFIKKIESVLNSSYDKNVLHDYAKKSDWKIRYQNLSEKLNLTA